MKRKTLKRGGATKDSIKHLEEYIHSMEKSYENMQYDIEKLRDVSVTSRQQYQQLKSMIEQETNDLILMKERYNLDGVLSKIGRQHPLYTRYRNIFRKMNDIVQNIRQESDTRRRHPN
jgi:predicted  nucleic acid-binding Zn-ribbon protein